MRYLIICSLFFFACNSNTDVKTPKNSSSLKKETELSLQDVKPGIVRNIFDYYLMLPEEYFLCDAAKEKDSEEHRTNSIVHKNIRNGFISSRPVGFYLLQTALFKDKKKNRDIIAVAINCGMGCMCNYLDFLTLDKNENWKNINKEILPEGIENPIVLPEHGTSIQCYDIELYPNEGDKISNEALKKAFLYELKWVGGKFQK